MKKTVKKRITISLEESDIQTLDFLVSENSFYDSKGREILNSRSDLIRDLINLAYRKLDKGEDIWE